MSTAEIVLVVVIVVAVVTPVAIVVAAKWAERRNPPTGRFLDIDGVRLHYVERGDAQAPPVVLFHGNGAMIQDLAGAGLIALLAARYRVICFDRPGFGHSKERPRLRMTPEAQAAVFEGALDRLNVRDPVLFGHSWGTLVALALALRLSRANRPLKGLVLASGYYFPTARIDVWIMSGPAIPVLGDIMRYTISPVLGWLIARPMIRKVFAPREVPESFKEHFPLSLALRPWQLRAAAEESAMMIPAAARLQAHYRELACQVVIFHASDDQIAEPEQGPRLHRAIAGSALLTVRDGGHMLHYFVPEEIVRAIDEIAASVRPQGGSAEVGGDAADRLLERGACEERGEPPAQGVAGSARPVGVHGAGA